MVNPTGAIAQEEKQKPNYEVTKLTIYLDHQASTPAFPKVLEKMQPFWSEFHGNPHSSEHSVGWAAHKAIQDARSKVAGLLGVDHDEILFTSGATEANNLAIKGIGSSMLKNKKRNVILIGATEHKCVLESASATSRTQGFTVKQIPVDKAGHIRLDELSNLLSEDVLLVSVALVNNEIGTIQKLDEISVSCRNAGAILHSDFAQAPSAVMLRQYADLADLVSLSGHKFGGPMGIGALYVSRELKGSLEPLFDGGGQEWGIRSGTLPLPLCVGMGAAAEFYASKAGADCRNRVAYLRDVFVRELTSSPHSIEVNGDALERRHPGNANLRFVARDASEIIQRLQPVIAASTGSACSSGFIEPSHVLKAIGLSLDEARASIRFSFGHSNTLDDAHQAVEAILSVL